VPLASWDISETSLMKIGRAIASRLVSERGNDVIGRNRDVLLEM